MTWPRIIHVLTLAAVSSLVWGSDGRGQSTIHVPSQSGTILEAILLAQPGDLILVAPGTYSETGIEFFGKDIEVRSTGGRDVTTIMRTSNGPVVRFVTGETPGAILDGFTISGGFGAPAAPFTFFPPLVPIPPTWPHSGGIACHDASPTIRNCRITQCRGGDASPANPFSMDQSRTGGVGGLLVSGTGTPTLIDCRIDQNSGGNGANFAFGVVNSTPVYSHATAGGAGGIDAPQVRLVRCTIEDNVGGDGGQNQLLPQTGTIFDLIAIDPRAGHGVECHATASLVEISSCQFRNNRPGADGANPALWLITMIRGTPDVNHFYVGHSVAFVGSVLRNSILLENAPATSASFFNVQLDNCTMMLGPVLDPGFLGCSLVNSIVLGTTVWSGPTGPFSTLADVNFCNIQGGHPGIGNIDVDPLFRDAAAGDFHLRFGSPCIDAGDSSLLDPGALHDIDGDLRVTGTNIDMGADESCLLGNTPSLALGIWFDGLGGLRPCQVSGSVGQAFQLTVVDVPASFVTTPVFVLLQVYGGSGPVLPAVFPEFHLDLSLSGVVGYSPAGTLNPFSFAMTVVPFPMSLTIRLQAVALTPAAPNGYFFAGDAREIVIR